MSKTLNWDAIASVNFDEKRRKATGSMTGKELFAKAHERIRKGEQALAQRQQVEPLLKGLLLDHMVNRKPITVLSPITNPTESLGGIAKGSTEEDDGFYNSSPSASVEAKANVKFETVMETIPAGTELTYKSWDKQLGQWIFKSDAGREYAVYDKSVIIWGDGLNAQQIENPGFYGLLFNTNLVSLLGED